MIISQLNTYYCCIQVESSKTDVSLLPSGESDQEVRDWRERIRQQLWGELKISFFTFKRDAGGLRKTEIPAVLDTIKHFATKKADKVKVKAAPKPVIKIASYAKLFRVWPANKGIRKSKWDSFVIDFDAVCKYQFDATVQVCHILSILYSKAIF